MPEKRYPFRLTFHAASGGTRMHGSGEGHGLDAVAWVADQLVAAHPSKATVKVTREDHDSFALVTFRVFVDNVQVA